MQRPDVRSCSYWLLHDRLFTTRYDEKTRKGEGEKNKMPRKKFSHSKFLKQQDACTGVKSACRREENGHNVDICVLRHVLRRLRLRQGQMQGFLGLKVGGGS